MGYRHITRQRGRFLLGRIQLWRRPKNYQNNLKAGHPGYRLSIREGATYSDSAFNRPVRGDAGGVDYLVLNIGLFSQYPGLKFSSAMLGDPKSSRWSS
jgi:hypothetical protein